MERCCSLAAAFGTGGVGYGADVDAMAGILLPKVGCFAGENPHSSLSAFPPGAHLRI